MNFCQSYKKKLKILENSPPPGQDCYCFYGRNQV